MKKDKDKVKKPIYKRVWFWGLVIIVIFLGANVSNITKIRDNTSYVEKATQSVKTLETSSEIKKSEASKMGKEKALSGLKGKALSQVKTAINYIEIMHLSKTDLYAQLTSDYGEKLKLEEANAAISKIEPLINWNNVAVLQAKSYREMVNMTGEDLLDQLTSQHGNQFTQEQARYGIDHIDDDVKKDDIWNK